MDPQLDPAIRRAIASGEFAKARSLWEEYAQQLENELRSGRGGAAWLEEARLLVEWSRQMALSAKSQALARLDKLARGSRVAAAYGSSSNRAPVAFRATRY